MTIRLYNPSGAILGSRRSRQKIRGLRFPSTSVYALGTNGDFNEAYKWLRIIWAPNVQLPNALTFPCGLDTGAGGSIALITQSLAAAGYSVGGLTGYDGTYAAGTGVPLHVLATSEIGRLRVTDLVLDDPGDKILHYEMGRLIRVGVASSDTSWSPGAGGRLAINTRPSTFPGGTFQFGDMTVFEIQLSTTAPTADVVLAAASQPIGTPVSGMTRMFLASEATAGASSWTDPRSGKILTVTGTTVAHDVARSSRSAGCVSIFGESHVMRDSGVLEGDGFRKALLFHLIDSGYQATAHGKFTFGANATKTYDTRHNGVPGQAWEFDNGAVDARMDTFAADLAAYVPRDGSLVLQGSTNDAFVYCVTQGKSVATAKADYFAILDTAIGLAGAHMNAGRPIVIPDALRLGTASIVNANQRDFLIGVTADLPAWVAARVGTYPGLRVAGVSALITPDQSTTDANLIDGTHMDDASRAIYGVVVAEAIMDALG